MYPEQNNHIEQIIEFCSKILIPSILGVTIKLITEMKTQKVTPLRAILSFIIGIAVTYLSYPLVTQYSSENMQPMFIAIIAMSAEKIGEFLIYKWNIDTLLTGFMNMIFTPTKKDK